MLVVEGNDVGHERKRENRGKGMEERKENGGNGRKKMVLTMGMGDFSRYRRNENNKKKQINK